MVPILRHKIPFTRRKKSARNHLIDAPWCVNLSAAASEQNCKTLKRHATASLISKRKRQHENFGVDAARPGTKAQIGFTAYSKKPYIHRSTNTAATPFHNIVIALLKPKPAGLAPAARPDGYVQVFDAMRTANRSMKDRAL
jgi:hypothetical protein